MEKIEEQNITDYRRTNCSLGRLALASLKTARGEPCGGGGGGGVGSFERVLLRVE